MTNAERIARDICLLSGQYERGEITAKGFAKKVEEVATTGCAGCAWKNIKYCAALSCIDGHEIWLDSEARA